MKLLIVLFVNILLSLPVLAANLEAADYDGRLLITDQVTNMVNGWLDVQVSTSPTKMTFNGAINGKNVSCEGSAELSNTGELLLSETMICMYEGETKVMLSTLSLELSSVDKNVNIASYLIGSFADFNFSLVHKNTTGDKLATAAQRLVTVKNLNIKKN